MLLAAVVCCSISSVYSESIGYGELEVWKRLVAVTRHYHLPHAPLEPLHLTVAYPQEEWRGEIEQLSWKPRAFLVKGFLSEAEADHIINMVRGGCPAAAAAAVASSVWYQHCRAQSWALCWVGGCVAGSRSDAHAHRTLMFLGVTEGVVSII